ncbi:MAG: chemotaxis protein CheW [Campylobacterota bacterium]|nr:chemotaxis protein CheW [Campylobacterota bacterium]
MSENNNEIQNKDNQYFLFLSNKDIYAVEALEVIEIVEYQQITKVPMMNRFVKGVTNIRGNIIAVLDLLDRFGVEPSTIYDKTSLVILRKEYDGKNLQIAIIIDEVYEVDNIPQKNIEKTPTFGTRIDKKYIKNMAKYNGEYIAILDINSILNIDDISMLSKQ